MIMDVVWLARVEIYGSGWLDTVGDKAVYEDTTTMVKVDGQHSKALRSVLVPVLFVKRIQRHGIMYSMLTTLFC